MAVAGAFAAPAVPAVSLVPIDALLSTNFVSFAAVDSAPAAPLVPVGLACALATHPVTVMVLFAAVLADGVCGVWASCARIPTLNPSAIAVHVADQILVFMVPPCFVSALPRATVRPDAVVREHAGFHRLSHTSL